MSRTFIFGLSLLYLLLLGLVAWLQFEDSLDLPGEIGTMPTAGILWFGALGGVLLSLQGVFHHADDWDGGYGLWHMARPLVGAAVGLVAVLVVQAGILAIGQDPNETASAGRATFSLYYVVAFLVGFREETFRTLIARVADVVLASNPEPPPAPGPTLSSIDPPEGSAAGGDSVTITGTGLLGTRAVCFGDTPTTTFTANSDGQINATTPPHAVEEVKVTVLTDSGSATGVDFSYRAPEIEAPAPGEQ